MAKMQFALLKGIVLGFAKHFRWEQRNFHRDARILRAESARPADMNPVADSLDRRGVTMGVFADDLEEKAEEIELIPKDQP